MIFIEYIRVYITLLAIRGNIFANIPYLLTTQ